MRTHKDTWTSTCTHTKHNHTRRHKHNHTHKKTQEDKCTQKVTSASPHTWQNTLSLPLVQFPQLSTHAHTQGHTSKYITHTKHNHTQRHKYNHTHKKTSEHKKQLRHRHTLGRIHCHCRWYNFRINEVTDRCAHPNMRSSDTTKHLYVHVYMYYHLPTSPLPSYYLPTTFLPPSYHLPTTFLPPSYHLPITHRRTHIITQPQ